RDLPGSRGAPDPAPRRHAARGGLLPEGLQAHAGCRPAGHPDRLAALAPRPEQGQARQRPLLAVRPGGPQGGQADRGPPAPHLAPAGAAAPPALGVSSPEGAAAERLPAAHRPHRSRVPRRVAVVEHQGVAVGVGEERHVADARVERVGAELHAAAFEVHARGGDIVDVQGERVGRAVVLQAHRTGVVDADREGPGLELRVVAVGDPDRAAQPQGVAVEPRGRLQVAGRRTDEVDPSDELPGRSHRSSSFSFLKIKWMGPAARPWFIARRLGPTATGGAIRKDARMSWDFSTDPDFQQDLDWMRELVREEIWPLEAIWHELGMDGLLRALAPVQEQVKERGLWAAHLPPELGGQGMGQVRLGLMHEILGTSPIAPLAFGNAAPDSGNSELIALAGTDEQKDTWLFPLLAGDLHSAFSMTEPHTPGSDPTQLATRASKDGDDWVIDGRKWFSSNASIADFLIVMAVTNPEARPSQRASMFIVPADTPGVEILRDVPTMEHPNQSFGQYGGHAEIAYESVRVPADALLGGEGERFILAQ